MYNLTEDQISAARANDIDAVSEVIRETDSRVIEYARRFATISGELNHALADDLAQAGRIAVWQAIKRFDGQTVDQFAAYLHRSLEGAMSDARRASTSEGVSASVAHDFERALRHASGDPYEAERAAVDPEVMGPRKMSPDMARAARLSWLGVEYLDAPAAVDEEGNPVSLGTVLAEEIGLPADLVESSDIERHRRKVIRAQVHRALGLLSERMAYVLKADHGITPVPLYGPEVPDSELAADMGLTTAQIHKARCSAQNRFSVLYLAGAHKW